MVKAVPERTGGVGGRGRWWRRRGAASAEL